MRWPRDWAKTETIGSSWSSEGLLAYYQIRNTTTDVDSARLIDPDLAPAIVEVAERQGLSG